MQVRAFERYISLINSRKYIIATNLVLHEINSGVLTRGQRMRKKYFRINADNK